MMQQKGVLGKGLASLLPGAAPMAGGATGAAAPAATAQASGAIPGVTFLSVDEIQANEYQPRRSFEDQPLEELAQSIRTNGIIQPLVVRRTANGFQLIAGERRLRASRIAGLKQVPVIVRRTTDKEALELALVENIQRQDLNCIDEALAYQQLMGEFHLTQDEAAQRAGKDRTSVANLLRLLKLPEAVIEDLKSGVLSLGHGKAILMLETPEQRLELRSQIIDGKLSVRQSEALAQQRRSQGAERAEVPAGASTVAPQQDPVRSRLAALAQTLTRAWSARVEVKGGRRKGKIVFHYDNPEQLERMLSAMQNPQLWHAPKTSPQA